MPKPVTKTMERELTYAECWPRYLRAHARPITRTVHCAGTSAALALAATGALRWQPR